MEILAGIVFICLLVSMVDFVSSPKKTVGGAMVFIFSTMTLSWLIYDSVADKSPPSHQQAGLVVTKPNTASVTVPVQPAAVKPSVAAKQPSVEKDNEVMASRLQQALSAALSILLIAVLLFQLIKIIR